MTTEQPARSDLIPLVYHPLPLGSIRPSGWLREQLLVQASGLSGHLDEFWADVEDSAWIGGKQEGWERGPYWLDGVVPLAILLDQPKLKEKARRWVDYILTHQSQDGWLGPVRNPKAVGSQHQYDPWPVFVLFKALSQWAEATGDARVAPAMGKFLKKLDALLAERPLFEWGRLRWADLVLSVHWLYERTGEAWLLTLGEKIHKQGFDWTGYAESFPFKEKITQKTLDGFKAAAGGLWSNDQTMSCHGVNVGMGIKAGAVWYRQSKDAKDREAPARMLAALDEYHGQATGMFSCDEHLAGKMPSQGTELCTVVETMFSLETLLATLGDVGLADRLERIAYNALPGAISGDMWTHQYDQQCNQVVCRVSRERIYSDNGPDANLFGLEPNFGCCTANMHQGWPKFVASLWMGTVDGGLACMAYGPCAISTALKGAGQVHLDVCTDYPFGDVVSVTVGADKPATFPLHFRIPGWVEGVETWVNDKAVEGAKAGAMWRVEREWKAGDVVRLKFARKPRIEKRFNDAVAVYYGPLVMSLKIDEDWRKLRGDFPRADYEVHPKTDWDYAIAIDKADVSKSIVIEKHAMGDAPFAFGDAPITAKVKGRKVKGWGIEKNAAAAPPRGPEMEGGEVELTLVPYGCTRLRVTEMPSIGKLE
ncbi:MAG TPA: beta-L-arabinofuranosidase domain-containing protein [Tepidisphaeraceae bacterium]|jgi:hypothetical protein